MKTVIQFIAMFITISGFAQSGDGGKKSATSDVKIISEQNTRIYKLQFNKKLSGAVNVRICNAADAVIFEETINGNGAFIRPYNLSRLPKDHYFIEVIDGNSLYRRTLSKSKEQLDLNDDFIRQVRINAIDSAKKKYMVTVTNNTGSFISIKIYNKKGVLIYGAEEEIEFHFGRIYDLSKINNTDFTFEISDRFGIIENVRIQEHGNSLATLVAGSMR